MTVGRAIEVYDDAYPASLHRLTRPPPRLYVDGSLERIDRAVGIVGTRRATKAALVLAHEMARALAERGVVIVSGGAEGIDRAAHEGALDARGGRTIAVLPTALTSPYPRAHAPLFERIATRGARLSEHATRTGAHRAHFVERNRIIAALSKVVVIVQAPVDSGALRTSTDAAALGIPVCAVPWSPNEPLAAGGIALLVAGARVVRDASDVLARMGEAPVKVRAKRSRTLASRDPDEQCVLALLDETPIDRESLVGRAELPSARAQAALARLVIDGLADEDAHGVRRGVR
jgi:DNA processing protein